MRTFANIRYALYGLFLSFFLSSFFFYFICYFILEYWLQYYNEQSYILILDFRDTFFQASPFQHLPKIGQRSGGYELMLFAENWKVIFIDLFFLISSSFNFFFNRLNLLVNANIIHSGLLVVLEKKHYPH